MEPRRAGAAEGGGLPIPAPSPIFLHRREAGPDVVEPASRNGRER